MSKPKHGHRHRSRRKRLGAGRSLGLLPSSTLDALPLLTADFESSISPKLAIVRAQLLGAISFQTREIGEQTYTRNPFAEVDGDKPWVSESAAERIETESKAGGESLPVPHLSGLGGGPEFRQLIVQLDDARSIVELGRRTVDGQETIEFEAKLDPKRTLGGLFSGGSENVKKGRSKGAKQRTSKSKKGGSAAAQGRSKQGAKRRLTQREKRLERTKVTLDLYLASNGLPVRTMFDISRGEVSLTLALDILATEIPISVQPPPASETITGAELRQHEGSGGGLLEVQSHRLTKREKAEAKRFEACMNRRLRTLRRHRLKRLGRRKAIKIVHECERRARLPSRPAKRGSHAHERRSRRPGTAPGQAK